MKDAAAATAAAMLQQYYACGGRAAAAARWGKSSLSPFSTSSSSSAPSSAPSSSSSSSLSSSSSCALVSHSILTFQTKQRTTTTTASAAVCQNFASFRIKGHSKNSTKYESTMTTTTPFPCEAMDSRSNHPHHHSRSQHPQLHRRWASTAAAAAKDDVYYPSKQQRSIVATTATEGGEVVVRLSKWISQHAPRPTSRRAAERQLTSGQVTLAGKPILGAAAVVSQAQLLDGGGLVVAGILIKPKPSYLTTKSTADRHRHRESTTAGVRVWLVHKLVGELVADSDPHHNGNRPTVMHRMMRSGVGKTIANGNTSGSAPRKQQHQNQQEHLKPIGRLDMNTGGLLLLTNCGMYARELELPSHAVHRTYRVRVHGILAPYKIQAMQRGVSVPMIATTPKPLDSKNESTTKRSAKNSQRTDKQQHPNDTSGAVTATANRVVRYGPMRVTVSNTRKKKTATNQWLEITCTQGKNRQIRNILAHFGLTVTRLIRVSYGDYQLQTIPPGMAIEVPVKSLAKQKHKGALKIPNESDKRGRTKKNPRLSPSSSSSSKVQWVRNVIRA